MEICIGILIMLGTAVVIVLLARPFVGSGGGEDYPADSCFETCPNMGTCEGCDCGYP